MPLPLFRLTRRRFTTVRTRFDDLSPIARTLLLCGSTALVVTAASADWTVERGDTLSHVARETGTSVSALVAANDIEDPDLILVGQRLEVPGGGSTRSSSSKSSSSKSSSSSTTSSSSSSAKVRTAVVRSGDSTSELARRLGVSRDQFMAANGFTSSSQVLAGSRVRSHAGPQPGQRSEPTTHVVTTGDTLIEIANDYDQSWRRLAELNDLSNASVIRLGQRLTIPGSGGAFRCPVAGTTTFMNDFGVSKGGGRYHEGIDIFASRGTNVLAPVSGRVEHVTGTRGGLQAHLFGDDGYRYWGTHMASLGRTGRVSAGDVLGTVGTSGNAVGTPPHLHFEVYWQGKSVNTYPTLRRAC